MPATCQLVPLAALNHLEVALTAVEGDQNFDLFLYMLEIKISATVMGRERESLPILTIQGQCAAELERCTLYSC